ncbi:hypothetical protein AB0I84_06135 [Streptomyces spectabilis]|uniref:hypothetical protein n=1 Tax=Streptomyces spectabilis TaxID=68270 RepID=UPI0033C8C8BC
MSAPMREPEKLAAAVQEQGALPMPMGSAGHGCGVPQQEGLEALAGYEPTVEALRGMIAMFRPLPRPRITLYPSLDGLDLSLSSPDAFERWRVALQIAPLAVRLHAFGDGAWLEADGLFHGVAVHMAVHGLQLTEEQALTPPPRSVPDGARGAAAVSALPPSPAEAQR